MLLSRDRKALVAAGGLMVASYPNLPSNSDSLRTSAKIVRFAGMEDFVAYESRGTLGFVLVMAGAILIGGLWTLGAFGAAPHPPGRSDREIFVVGLCFVIFSGICGFLTFKSFLNPSEILRIGPQGVRFSKWSEETIPWSQITKVSTWRGNKQKAIVLFLQDPDRYPGSRRAEMVAADLRNYVKGDIFLNLSGTNQSFADAVTAIQRFQSVG